MTHTVLQELEEAAESLEHKAATAERRANQCTVRNTREDHLKRAAGFRERLSTTKDRIAKIQSAQTQTA